ncbi:hypothetical protein Leryth_006428 [Lithospermum erythrorhizon]|nr:hypothetical protein Leryth_006428 [Lithospermum erythrorhizon]
MEIHHHHQEPQKVYVAIGSDTIDGFGALKFALKKWSSELICIVILHATNDICKDYVFTPFGKLPASSLSEEKLKGLERAEQARNDQILAKYIAYCGKVKAEVVKIDKHDKPFQEVLLELISSLKISKLVMALTFMRLSSWKSKSAISGSFFVHQNKPDFCELFMIYCGELVFFKGEGENDGIIEDVKGVIVGRVQDRNSFKKWFGRMWSEKGVDNGKTKVSPRSSSLPSTSSDSNGVWGKYHEEIEQYFNQLVSSNEEGTDNYVTDDILMNDSPDSDTLKNMV